MRNDDFSWVFIEKWWFFMIFQLKVMIFHRKMMISHDFTIILGVREKNIAYPPRTKKKRVPGTRNSRKPSAASKTEPPNLRGTRLFFFRVPGTKFAKLKNFCVPGTRPWGVRLFRNVEYRASKCRTRRTALDARGSRSEECSVAFTLADVELRVARFRRAHHERKSQCHGDTSTADSQAGVIRKNTPLSQGS